MNFKLIPLVVTIFQISKNMAICLRLKFLLQCLVACVLSTFTEAQRALITVLSWAVCLDYSGENIRLAAPGIGQIQSLLNWRCPVTENMRLAVLRNSFVQSSKTWQKQKKYSNITWKFFDEITISLTVPSYRHKSNEYSSETLWHNNQVTQTTWLQKTQNWYF